MPRPNASIQPARASKRVSKTGLTPFALAVAASCIGWPAQAQETAPARQETREAREAAMLPPVDVTGEMIEESYTSEAVTVGSKTAATLKETPHSVTVITRQRIEDQNLTTLDEVMAQTPGITVDLSGTGVIPAFYSRGYPVEYFQYDGVPIQTGGASWSQPDMIMFEQVEVLRGAAGLFNGAGQPGGAINLVRKRPTRQRQLLGSFSAGSWNTYRGEIDFSTPLTEGGAVRMRLAAAYDDRESHVDYANGQRTSLYGIVEADLAPRTTIAFGAGYQKRDWLPPMFGVPRYSDGRDLGLSRSTLLVPTWTYWDFETTQVFVDFTHAFADDWKLKLSAVSDHETSDLKYGYVRGSVNPLTLAGPMLLGGANAYDNEQLAVDANLTGAFHAFGRRHDVVVGANWYDRKADSWGGSLPGFGGTPVDIFSFDPTAIADPGDPNWTSKSRADTRQHGVYGSVRFRLSDPLALILGGRVSWWDTQSRNLLTGAVTADYDEGSHFTPYAGVVYDLGRNWAVYASYADIHRVQSNLRDSSGNGLPPVSGANYEAGIKGAFHDGRLNASFSVFRIEETDRAIQVSDTVVGGCCYETNGKVRSQGFDAEIAGQLLPGWQIGAGYTLNTSKYLADPVYQGQPFRSLAPKHLLRLWTSYRLPGQWNAWTIAGGVNAQSGIYSEGGNPSVRVAQGGYAVTSLRVGYRIDRHWSAALNINNVFDKTYYTRLGSANFGPATLGNVYGAPRSVMLTLRTRF